MTTFIAVALNIAFVRRFVCLSTRILDTTKRRRLYHYPKPDSPSLIRSELDAHYIPLICALARRCTCASRAVYGFISPGSRTFDPSQTAPVLH